MKIKDLIKLYEEKEEFYGDDAYKHVSELFQEAKQLHYNDWLKNQLNAEIMNNRGELLREKTSKN